MNIDEFAEKYKNFIDSQEINIFCEHPEHTPANKPIVIKKQGVKRNIRKNGKFICGKCQKKFDNPMQRKREPRQTDEIIVVLCPSCNHEREMIKASYFGVMEEPYTQTCSSCSKRILKNEGEVVGDKKCRVDDKKFLHLEPEPEPVKKAELVNTVGTTQKCARCEKDKIIVFCNDKCSLCKSCKNTLGREHKRLVDRKIKVIELYGGECAWCEEKRIDGLSIDHVDGGGCQERGNNFYKRIEKQPKSPKLQCLCGTCQFIKRHINKECARTKDVEVSESNSYKQCAKCEEFKPVEMFNKKNAARIDGLSKICISCWRDKVYARKLRIFEAYGNECKVCGCADPRGLCIDHINNDGAAHRAEVGNNIYDWLEQNGFPQNGYRCLCMTCNWIKARGECKSKYF